MESYLPPLIKRFSDSCRLFFSLLFPGGEAITLPQDTVVVVLDVIEPYRALWSIEKAAHLCAVVNGAHRNGHRVVFTRWVRTRFYPADAIARLPNPHWSHFVHHSSLDEDGKTALMHPALVVESGDTVLDAVHTNVLAHKELDLPVGAPLLLTGMWTESCVLNSARAAVEDDRDVYVYAPACAGHLNFLSLWAIQALYARVVHNLKWDL